MHIQPISPRLVTSAAVLVSPIKAWSSIGCTSQAGSRITPDETDWLRRTTPASASSCRGHEHRHQDPTSVGRDPEVRAARSCPRIEVAGGASVPFHRLLQVVRAPRSLGLARLLRLVADAAQVPVAE